VIALPFEGDHVDIGQAQGYVEANLLYAADDRAMLSALQPTLKKLIGIGV
jgi:UTP-glucose-1-phosphate uridylyltransferase